MRERAARAGVDVGRAISNLLIATTSAIASIGFLLAAPAAADGEVVIETMANDKPADSAPGPTVESGATVTVRYVVTVASSEPLYDFVVTNQTGSVQPACDTDGDNQPDATNVHPGPLSNGDSFFCEATITAGEPGVTFATVGRVTAYDFDVSSNFVDDDAAHYTTSRPTTTQAPTTAPPSTASTTAAPPTTLTTATTSSSTTASTEPTTASSTSTTPTTSAASTDSWRSTSTSPAATSASSQPDTPSSRIEPGNAADENAPPPDELADRGDDPGRPVLWWIVIAFSVGGAVAAGAGSHLAGKNAAVPDH